MQDHKNLSEIKVEDQKIIENKELNLLESLIPVVILMSLLAYNIFFVEDQEWLGAYTNQYILLMGGLVSAAVGFFNKVPLNTMIAEIWGKLEKCFCTHYNFVFSRCFSRNLVGEWHYSCNGLLWTASSKSVNIFARICSNRSNYICGNG